MTSIFDKFSLLDPERALAQIDAGLAGGGSPSIKPETGSSSIKISTFPAAALPMGAGDLVTGIQGGANANFSQTQIFSGQTGIAPIGAGGQIQITAGFGSSDGGLGGNAQVRAGTSYGLSQGGTTGCYGGDAMGNAAGGNADLWAGNSLGGNYGGNVRIKGGHGAYGGFVRIAAGAGYSNSGGYLYLYSGPGNGAGKKSGDITFAIGPPQAGAANGNLILSGMTSTPGAAAGTLTNAPKAGDPQTWLAVTINNVQHWIPAWHA